MKIEAVCASVALCLLGFEALANTVDWYKANTNELTAMIKKCRNNPGELRNTPDCINASAAVDQLRSELAEKSAKAYSAKSNAELEAMYKNTKKRE